MANVGPPNARPTVVVDGNSKSVLDPSINSVGAPRPLGRERLVWALPLNPGPAFLRNASLVAAPSGQMTAIGDSLTVALGGDVVLVSRMLIATPAEDTRSMGGGGAP